MTGRTPVDNGLNNIKKTHLIEQTGKNFWAMMDWLKQELPRHWDRIQDPPCGWIEDILG
jgi:hypothetical protein